MAAPPQAAEEAETFDLIQETEWRKDLSNTITLIGNLGCVLQAAPPQYQLLF